MTNSTIHEGQTAHTPGPWTVMGYTHDSVSVMAGEKTVATIRFYFSDEPEEDEARANARLIASAPSLSARVEELERINGELLNVLREAEWGGIDLSAPVSDQDHCPVCSMDEETGHWEYCRLGRILAQHSKGGTE